MIKNLTPMNDLRIKGLDLFDQATRDVNHTWKGAVHVIELFRKTWAEYHKLEDHNNEFAILALERIAFAFDEFHVHNERKWRCIAEYFERGPASYDNEDPSLADVQTWIRSEF